MKSILISTGVIALACSAQASDEISVSELSAKPVIGTLNHRLGEVVTISGVIFDGDATRQRSDVSRKVLRVTRINGNDCEATWVRLRDARLEHKLPAIGQRFELRGYESGGFVGTPAEANTQRFATQGFHFATWFVIVEAAKAENR